MLPFKVHDELHQSYPSYANLFVTKKTAVSLESSLRSNDNVLDNFIWQQYDQRLGNPTLASCIDNATELQQVPLLHIVFHQKELKLTEGSL